MAVSRGEDSVNTDLYSSAGWGRADGQRLVLSASRPLLSFMWPLGLVVISELMVSGDTEGLGDEAGHPGRGDNKGHAGL